MRIDDRSYGGTDPASPPHRTTAEQGEARRPRRYRRLHVAIAAAAVLSLVAVLAAPFATALVTVADGLGFDPPRPFAAEVEREQAVLGDVEVDRYVPSRSPRAGRVAGSPTPAPSRATDRPAVLLLPGATPAGRDDRRVVEIATAFARTDRLVVVPELEVYDEDLRIEDVQRIVTVSEALAADQGQVVLAGLSFGGSLALLAAARPSLEERVALVATFGAYVDLAGVVQAATTGGSLVEGERHPWDPDPRAGEVVREQTLGLLSPQDRDRVNAALEGDTDPDELDAELRAVHDLLTETDPARTLDHLDASPEVLRERIAEVSPARAAPQLDVPVIALHARDDPVIPHAELRRLEATYPHARTLELVTFDHVGLGDDQGWWVTARDLWQTARFADAILSAG